MIHSHSWADQLFPEPIRLGQIIELQDNVSANEKEEIIIKMWLKNI